MDIHQFERTKLGHIDLFRVDEYTSVFVKPSEW
ncbi:Uncharacterised protein [Serratia fonticola]|nr:Uncharacterised protein [Serratia fonticola]